MRPPPAVTAARGVQRAQVLRLASVRVRVRIRLGLGLGFGFGLGLGLGLGLGGGVGLGPRSSTWPMASS